ncbi:MAG: hypothetical protein ACK535_01060, partial [Cyanobacteriota bacterium]
MSPSGAGSIRCRLVLIPPRQVFRHRLQLRQSLDLVLDYLELFQLKLKQSTSWPTMKFTSSG